MPWNQADPSAPGRLALLFVLLPLAAAAAFPSDAPEWRERLNRDGIVVWTRPVEGYKLDSYRAQADLDAPIGTVYRFLTDLSGFMDFVQYIESFEPISAGENRWLFYIVIDPPVSRNRDYVGLMTAVPPGPDGTAVLDQVAVEGYRPPREHTIRILDFRQRWTLVKLDDHRTRATLEVLYDPGGNPPVAILNWLAAQGPYETFLKMKSVLETP